MRNMMKISKAVMANEFVLSTVQFTSLNSIVFKNIKNVYEGNEKISLEYEHSPKIEASSRDWIGIFPRGWNTLQQYVTFEWVSQSLPCPNTEQNKENGELVRRIINFCPKYHTSSVNNHSFYQFVYVSKQIEVLGVSSYFRFDLKSSSDTSLELECLVPVSNKILSTSVSDYGTLLGKNLSSSTSLDTRTLQTNSIHSLQNLDVDGKNWTKSQIPLNIADVKKTSILPRKSTGNGDALDPYSSHSEPVFPMSFQMSHCKKCFHFKRGGELMRSQQVLQSKVGPRSEEASEFNGQRRTFGYLSEDKLKIVMERNKVLEERTQEMKKEMERLQAESKKLKMSFYNTSKEKSAYEKFVKDFIKSLEKDSIVRIINGNTEILVKKVNYVGMEEHPRDKKTSKRERELKAVIGLQEITIRNLINSLQEKAKSVQDLNQTVKLAQAFSAAQEDSREYASDDEEGDVSNSDDASEYEFSVTKPSQSNEVTVEEAETVLDDIRRSTEMELKDIGISRSLGKSSSRDLESELGLPNLSVCSYQNQNEGTRPKKPRLFDNVEDCWPLSEKTPKTFHQKIIDHCPQMEEEKKEPERKDFNEECKSSNTNTQIEPQTSERECENTEMEGDQTNLDNYYDACEVFNTPNSMEETNDLNGTIEEEDTNKMDILEEVTEDGEKQKKNFLVTAIIPHDFDTKPKQAEDWTRVEDEVPEKKPETVPEKGKKLTCELSIDFATRVPHNQESFEVAQPALDCGDFENVQKQICKPSDLNPSECQVKQEKSLLTLKKQNKCLEIKITQVDQKENAGKNYLHQKMVLKFEKNAQQDVETNKPAKFQFNLAVTGMEENANENKPETDASDSPLEIAQNEEHPVEEQTEDRSPRSVWNDAIDEVVEEEASILEKTKEEENMREETPRPATPEVVEENQEETLDEPKEVFESMNMCEDSLRYEKNLEFLQQKVDEKVKKLEEEAAKDKPSAILIQNGQTKLALIRYQ